MLADTAPAASMAGEPSAIAGALEDEVRQSAQFAPATSAAQPAGAEPSPLEQALAVARRLAPGIVAPTDCGPPPLDAPSLLPNAARAYRSGIHQGIDYSCGARGRQAVAALDGRVVVAAGDYRTPSPARRNALLAIAAQRNSTPSFTLIALYGNYVVVDHGLIDGAGHVVTIYAYLETVAADIRVGTPVRAGDPLGTIGNTGTSYDAAGDPDGGLHLHWEVHIDDRYLAAGLSSAETRAVYTALFEKTYRTHTPAGDRQDRAPPVVTAPRPSEGAAAEPLAAASAAPDGAGAGDGVHTTPSGSDALDAHVAGGDQAATVDAPGPADSGAESLADLLDELVRVAADWNPTGRASIAVVTADGVLHGVNENRPHVSASAVKALWTAAAIDQAGTSAVAPLAHATLAQSDNYAAGSVIDLIGIDAVNTWTRDIAGLAGTQVASWSYGKRRFSQSAIDGGGYANLTTAADLARFYALLHGNELLGADGTVALLGWLRDTPRGSGSSATIAGALLSRLLPTVAAEATHKAGWLPPNCCSNDHRLIIDAGGIALPSGDWFGIAAVADGGQDYNLSVRWVAYAACRVYVMLARDDDHSCKRAGDGPS